MSFYLFGFNIMTKQLYEILVPTLMDNKPIHTRYHRVWDSKVRAISGGLSILPVAHGHWIAPDGALFIERMIPVRIMCTREQIEKIADISAEYYKQQAIFHYKVSDEVVITHYDEKFKRKGTDDV